MGYQLGCPCAILVFTCSSNTLIFILYTLHYIMYNKPICKRGGGDLGKLNLLHIYIYFHQIIKMNLRKSPRCLAAAFDLPVHLELGILIGKMNSEQHCFQLYS